jgi:glutamate 5-kinase
MDMSLISQPLPQWRRAVLKVGSSLLAADGGGLDARYAQGLADFIASSHGAGREVILVSSGAVAAGRAVLRAKSVARSDLAARQALAALGQASVIALWQSLSQRSVAQVLLTHDDVRNRRRYLNARATLRELLAVEALPVINENDTVSVDELKLGDNDNLAAIVAALVDADLLLIASDVDALFSADPRRDPQARPLANVRQVTAQVLALAGGSGTTVGTGGMRSKLEAAARAASAGIPTALFNGRDADTVALLRQGTLRGTLVAAQGTRVQARKHWLSHASAGSGAIAVDAGAVRALLSGTASLLPGGVTAAVGEFHRGDLVTISGQDGCVIARGLSQYSAAEIRRLAGRHSRDIASLLGYSYGSAVVHRDDLVVVAENAAIDEWITP